MESVLFSTLARDKRLWLLLLVSALALGLGFFAFPGDSAIFFVSKFGYWFLLGAVLVWVLALKASYRAAPLCFEAPAWDWVVQGTAVAGWLVLLVHEAPGFKILMDEVMLLGTSMSMHFDRDVLTPTRGNDIQGAFVIMDGLMDKRPLFFPFLLSLVHDLSGYRPENAFVLNGGLTLVLLTLCGVLGRSLAGRAGGLLAVLLLTGLPLLGHNALGGGFEVLNLTMILATVLLGLRWLRLRDEGSLSAFVYTGILLMQTRYESVVFALPVAFLVVWVWWEEGRVRLPWPVVFAPLFLVPYPLQHRIFELRTSAWELASQPGYEKPFSLAYIPENLGHALAFYFSRPSEHPSSLVFSALGFLALPVAGLLVLRRLRMLRSLAAERLATTVFAIALVLHFALLMAYFWGRFDDPIIRRLSFPSHLLLLLAVLFALEALPWERLRWTLVAVAAFGVLAQGIPSMALHAYSQEYLPGKETAWRRQFMKEQKARDILVIDSDSILWISHQISATPVLQAMRRKEALQFHLRNRTFSAIYVFQRLEVDPETGRQRLREGDDLGPDFELETVREQRLQALFVSRISRVVAIRSGTTRVAAEEKPEDKVVPKDPKEVERLRRAYLENFVKQLP